MLRSSRLLWVGLRSDWLSYLRNPIIDMIQVQWKLRCFVAGIDVTHLSDVALLLRKKDKTAWKLTVRIRDDAAAASGSTRDHPAGTSANLTATSLTADIDAALASTMDDIAGVRASLASPRAATATNTISTAGDAAISPAQSNVVDSFTSLMDKLSVVV